MPVFQRNLFQGNGEFDVGHWFDLADAATGSDQLGLLAGTVLGDEGAGVDALQLELPFGDPAVGVETLSILARVTLNDSAHGLESLDPNGAVPVPAGDPGSGFDQLAVEAHIPLIDAAVGTDILIRTTVGTGPIHHGGGGGRPRARPYLETDTFGALDRAQGGEDFTLEAFLAAFDLAAGSDEIAVDKHYPQLEAFHLLAIL